MKKTEQRKLVLNKLTLKTLSTRDLTTIAGGGLTNNNCSRGTCATE